MDYLRLLAIVSGGWLLGMSADMATERRGSRDRDPAFLEGKLMSAWFFCRSLLQPSREIEDPLYRRCRRRFDHGHRFVISCMSDSLNGLE